MSKKKIELDIRSYKKFEDFMEVLNLYVWPDNLCDEPYVFKQHYGTFLVVPDSNPIVLGFENGDIVALMSGERGNDRKVIIRKSSPENVMLYPGEKITRWNPLKAVRWLYKAEHCRTEAAR